MGFALVSSGHPSYWKVGSGGVISSEVDRVETLRDVQTWHAAATEILRAGWFSPESGAVGD